MDAAVLGGAMIAMARLVEHSTAILYGSTAPINVEVAADFETGSFSFQVVTTTPDIAAVVNNVLGSIDMDHVLTVLGITGGGGGLIQLVRWLYKRGKVKEIAPIPGSNNVEVKTEDGNSTVVHADTVNLFQNSVVLVDLHGVVAPLEREGINEFRVGAGRVAETTVRDDDLQAFEPPAPMGEILQEKDSDEIIQLDTVHLLRPGKWQFRLPDGTYFSSRLTPEVRAQIPQGVKFGAGDAFLATVHLVVTRDASGIMSAKREIVKIVKYLPAPRQLNFGLLPDGDE